MLRLRRGVAGLSSLLVIACEPAPDAPALGALPTAVASDTSVTSAAPAGSAPAVASARATPPAPFSPEVEARIDAITSGLLPPLGLEGVDLRMRLEDRMKRLHVPAVGAAVIDGGKVEWARTWGVLEHRKDGAAAPATRDTLFQAASLSKPITAVIALSLVQEGKLELDANVNDTLKTWKIPDAAGPVTLRALLSHTARISAPEQAIYLEPDGTFTGYPRQAPMPTTLQILRGEAPAKSVAVARFADGAGPCANKPDPCFSYSGGGYMIVQLLIEEATGRPFAEVAASRVFGPLKMTHSTFATEPPSDDVARAHTAAGDAHPTGWVAVAERAGGGLWSTPEDLALFLIDLMGAYDGEDGHVLLPETARVMLEPYTDARPFIIGSVGLGMFMSGKGDARYLFHNGHNPGYHATFLAVPKTKKGMVILLNQESGVEVMTELGRAMADAYDWPEGIGLRPKVKPLGKSTDATMRGLVGTYSGGFLLGNGLTVVVRKDGDALWAKVDDADEVRLYPKSEREFVDPVAPALLRFEGEGAAAKVTYDSPLGSRSATRDR